MPAYQSHATNGTVEGSGTTITIDKPSGTAEGDLLVAQIVHGTGSQSTLDGGQPSGWTQIGVGNNADHNIGVWWKIAGAAEPANYTFTSTIDNDMSGEIIRISGAHPTTPINAQHIQLLTATASAITNNVTTTVDNCLLIFFACQDDSANATWTWDGALQERYDEVWAPSFVLIAASDEAVTAQQNYSRTATKTGGTRRLAGVLLAIAPSAAAADPAILSEIVESEVAFDDTLHEWVFWLTPADVVVEEMPPATADLGNETDRVTDDTEVHGHTLWLTREDFEVPPLSASFFEESEAVATEALEWFSAATEDLVEEPPIPACTITDLFESDDTEHNWQAWQVPDDVLPEDFMPGALLVLAEAEFRSDDTLHNWTMGPNLRGGLPGFTIGLVRVTSAIKGAVVTSGLKTTKVVTTYKGVRDGTTE